MLLSAMSHAAPNVEFNPQFLQGNLTGQLDLERFSSGDDLPGIYSADVKVNDVLVARRDVEVRASANGTTVLCLSPDLFTVLGIDPARLPRAGDGVDADGQPVEVRPLPDSVTCEPLSTFVPQGTAHFDAGEQALQITIPQAYLSRDPRGWVSPELWDDGINVGLLGYSISHQQIQSSGYSQQTTNVMLNTGVNLGAWRLRHDGYLSVGGGHGGGYRAGRSFAQRSIASWGMELTAGEASTRGDLFDGVGFRGISLSTDPRMLPDSQREYAPVVRGVAQSSARVVIRQRDTVLYQTNVAAGPFEISDLYGTAYAGDLDVEVTENDGRVQRFRVPFASVPQLLRVGQQRFSATVGTLNDNWLRNYPSFIEATLRRGLSNRVTAFGGITASPGYGALLVGGALDTQWGAFSGDITVSRAQLPLALPSFGTTMQGQSYRLTFSKDLPDYGTNVSMAAYRYSTDGYLSLADAARLRSEQAGNGEGSLLNRRQRSRLDLTLNQRLGDRAGSLFVSANSVDYWNQSQRQTNFSVGFAGTLGLASYSLTAQRSVQRRLGGGAGREANSIYFNLTMPLGSRSNAPQATVSADRRSEGGDRTRVGIAGTFGEDRQASYSAAVSQDGGQGASYDAGASYQASAAIVSAGYTFTPSSHGLNLGATGGIVFHSDGVAFAQRLGDTIGLVQVPGAVGALLDSSVGVKTDRNGYAVVPYMTPFRRNQVNVDPKGLPMDVELKTTSAIGVPTAGAVIKLVVPTTTGRSALIEARRADGQALPFGMDVYDQAGAVVGVVGQGSRLWVRGIEETGRLTVKWGAEPGQECAIDYALESSDPAGLLTAQCVVPVRD
ncbi:fimbria/pilus outer membrane usher protein [Stenotrophomonas sp. WHRI 8082]|uniref:fimbria/pilus outer membrane usher protein n=1 Tax=Stenotrophomonas sp. WHRI 8082 TaxID=3162571 RepID=UPI003557011E